MIFSKFNRFLFIIKIILNYGLIECIPAYQLISPLKTKNRFLLRLFNKHSQFMPEERFRLALQKLGPIWIKFGQILSTRRDIFSDTIINQLTMLQDRVEPFDGTIARMQIEQSIGNSLETWFEDFQEIPIASASIAQVHSAKLKKNNKDIVIKVIRPGIASIIKTDISLMHKLSNWIYKFLPEGKKFKFSTIILEYEKTLFNELNLLKETANTIQLRRNFKKSNILYIPKVYVNLCSKNIMVMERIYGIPIYDLITLQKKGINMKLLAKRGIQIFFIQTFKNNFFHGDMHPGNIFVDFQNPNNPKYISVDCGIVGSLNHKDKYYLAANFIALFNHDYQKIAELHLDSGWIPMNTNTKDFECAIRTVFEPIFETPLQKIFFSDILLHLFNIAQNFQMEVQPQLILLQKTLLYVEDMIRQICPHLNLWQYYKPFLEQWMKDQLKLSTMIRTLKNKIPFWSNHIPELPTIVFNELKNSYKLQKKIEKIITRLNTQRTNNTQAFFLFGIGTTLITNSIFWITKNQHTNIISTILLIFGIFIWIKGWKRIN